MEAEIGRILSTANCNGGSYWARSDGDIHAPAGFSTIDVLGTLGSLGVKAGDHRTLDEAIGFVLSRRAADGKFRYGERSAMLPCISARILAALGRLQYSDGGLEVGYRHLLETQSHDGGWRCPTARMGRSPETDVSNPGTTLYVLDAFLYRKNTANDLEKLGRAVSFLLKHWETRKPLGPCGFGIGTTFMKTEFPMLRYNILYYCHVLSRYGAAAGDPRFHEAAAVLRGKVKDGLLVVENPHRLWQDYRFARKGEPSGPATDLVRDLLRGPAEDGKETGDVG
jgi:hypothetical protein